MGTAVQSNPFVEWGLRYYDDPVLFVREVIGAEPDEDQQQVLRWLAAGERRISWRSGHGIGKSTGLAWAITWFATTRSPYKVLCTAPTSTQLFEALASETKAAFKSLPLTLRNLYEIKTDSIVNLQDPERHFVSFATSRAETPEALAGKHSENMLIIADEASGIPEQVFEAASGSMSGHNATTILTGNPVRTSGLFFDTHHKLRDVWKTHHTPCIYPDGRLHPRITRDFIEDMKRRYGEDSNAYRVRVLGEFPRSEDDVVIPYELVEAALKRDVKPLLHKPIWGLDVAYTGNDLSALAKRKGNWLQERVRTWKGLDTMQLCGTIYNEWRDTEPANRPEEIVVDAIGFGAGTADRLRELGLPARGINVAELPSIKGRYANLKAELWFTAREWFEARDCNLNNDEALMAQLVCMHYLPPTSSGKVKLENSEKTRKMLGSSPDRASAFVMTFASTAATALHGIKNAPSWTQPLKRSIPGIV